MLRWLTDLHSHLQELSSRGYLIPQACAVPLPPLLHRDHQEGRVGDTAPRKTEDLELHSALKRKVRFLPLK